MAALIAAIGFSFPLLSLAQLRARVDLPGLDPRGGVDGPVHDGIRVGSAPQPRVPALLLWYWVQDMVDLLSHLSPCRCAIGIVPGSHRDLGIASTEKRAGFASARPRPTRRGTASPHVSPGRPPSASVEVQ